MSNDTFSSQDFDEPLYRISSEDQKRLYFVLGAIITQLGGSLDEMFWTPLRDFQVFAKKTFGSAYGPHHPLVSFITVGGALVANLPFLCKVFNVNEINVLQNVLENCEAEFPENESFFKINDDGKKVLIEGKKIELEKKLNNDLKEKAHNYNIKATIETKTRRRAKNYFRKEEYCDIKYEISGPLQKFLSGGKCEKNEKKYSEFTFSDVFEYLFDKKIEKLKSRQLEDNKKDDQYVARKYFIDLLREHDKKYDDHNKAIDGRVPQEKTLKEVLDDLMNLIQKGKKKDRKKIVAVLSGHQIDPEKIMAFAKIAPIFFDKDGKLDPKATILDSRQKFIESLNSFSIKDAANHTYALINDSAFNFWLGWLITDISSRPSIIAALVVVGGGILSGFLKMGLKLANHLKNKVKNLRKSKQDAVLEDEVLAENEIPPIEFADKSLKHSQLERIFINERTKHFEKSQEQSAKGREQSAKGREQRAIVADKAIKTEVKAILSCSSEKDFENHRFQDHEIKNNVQKITPKKANIFSRFFSRLFSRFFSRVTSVKEHREVLRDQIGEKNTFDNGTVAAAKIASTGVQISFIQWFAGVAIYAGLAWRGLKIVANKVGKFFNKGLAGMIVGVASFALGAVIGGVIYGAKTRNELKARKEKLKADYEAKETKLEKLLKIEAQNEKLQQLLQANGIEAYTKQKSLAPHDDRAFRRLTTTTTPKFSLFKQLMNRISVIIGRLGSGILLWRLVVLAILTFVFGVIPFPFTIAALTLGAIWACVYTYKYVKESRIKASERFLHDLDNRLLCAKENQNILLKQLGCEREKPAPDANRGNAVVEKQEPQPDIGVALLERPSDVVATQQELKLDSKVALLGMSDDVVVTTPQMDGDEIKNPDKEAPKDVNHLVALPVSGEKLPEQQNDTGMRYKLSVHTHCKFFDETLVSDTTKVSPLEKAETVRTSAAAAKAA